MNCVQSQAERISERRPIGVGECSVRRLMLILTWSGVRMARRKGAVDHRIAFMCTRVDRLSGAPNGAFERSVAASAAIADFVVAPTIRGLAQNLASMLMFAAAV
jgi:hypothetical protein